MGPLTLEGGRYDGWTFQAEGGWEPGSDVGLLYICRPVEADWKAAVAKIPSPAVFTTTLVPMTFCARAAGNPPDWDLRDWEAYVRCRDGRFRAVALARCS